MNSKEKTCILHKRALGNQRGKGAELKVNKKIQTNNLCRKLKPWWGWVPILLKDGETHFGCV